MKAVVTNGAPGAGAVSVVDRPEPGPPGPGQVLVRVRAVSLNYRDLLVARGVDRWAPPPGRILGSDAAGEVVAVGPDVSWPRVGERVIGAFLPAWRDGPATAEKMRGSMGGALRDGVFADYVLLEATALVASPAHMSDEEAATLVCAGVTAWQALTKADSLRPGRSLLVQGTGGVSMLALQIAHAAGARVIATSSRDDKLDRALALGAAHGVNYRAAPEWQEEALRLTDGVGVDHVIDVGGAATLARSVTAAAYEGVVSLVGLLGGAKVEVDVIAVHLRGIRLQGVETGSRAMLDDLARWSERIGLHPHVGATLPMRNAPEAFAGFARQDTVGKTCMLTG